jgi:hypothetical protein
MKPRSNVTEDLKMLYNVLSTFECLLVEDRLLLTFNLTQNKVGVASD